MRLAEDEITKSWSSSEIVVSICCITYNHENFLSDALDGFLMQKTDFPFEVLVGEDCSTDNTMQIVNKYAEVYPEIIRVVKSETNVGAVENFYRIEKLARGRYIACCDGDDYWQDPLKLTKSVAFLDKNSDYVLTYSSAVTKKEGNIIEAFQGANSRDLEQIDLERACDLNTLTVCYRNCINEFPPEMHCAPIGDVFKWSLLGAFGKGKYLPDVAPSVYRIHSGGVYSEKTSKHRQRMRAITLALLMAYHHRIGNVELSEYFGEQLCISSMKAVGFKKIAVLLFKALIRRISK